VWSNGHVSGSERLRLIFAALLISWLIFPLGQTHTVAQDGLAYVAAGRLATSHPGAVYVHRLTSASWRLDPRFATTACHLAPVGTDCAKRVVPFLSAPAAIPIVVPIARLGGSGGALAMRYIAVGALVAGLWWLWRRRDRDTPGIDAAFVVVAFLMIPFAYEMSIAGQTSSLLLLAASLGLPMAEEHGKTWVSAITLALVSAFKVIPAAMLLVAALRRRWRLVLITIGALVALSIAGVLMAPGVVGGFIRQTSPTTTTQVANTANASIDAALRSINHTWGAMSPLFEASVALRGLIVLALGFLVMRAGDDDLLWAFGWVAILVVDPIVWWHYLGVLVPLAAVLSRRMKAAWILPVAALPLALSQLINGRNDTLIVSGSVLIATAFAVWQARRRQGITAETARIP